MTTFLTILMYTAFACLFLIVPAIAVFLIIRTARQTSARVGHCRDCGYDLRPLASDRCPRCGRRFVRDAQGAPMS